jgi:hypothetical protein
LYAGQPGYSRKLDRDGDGVACETGSGGGVASAPVPFVPAAPPVEPTSPPIAAGGALTVVVDWTGTDCLDISIPSQSNPRTLETVNQCGGHVEFQQAPATSDSYVGADPSIGTAATLSCEIKDGRLVDSGTQGDGHDVTCLTTASALA